MPASVRATPINWPLLADGSYTIKTMPATAIIDRTMKAGVIRSRRNHAARNRIISGSRAHSRTYRLAVIDGQPDQAERVGETRI